MPLNEFLIDLCQLFNIFVIKSILFNSHSHFICLFLRKILNSMITITKNLEKECFMENKKFRCVFLDLHHWEFANTGYYKCIADPDIVQCNGFFCYCGNYSYKPVQLGLF